MVKYDIYTYDEEADSIFLAFPVEYEFQQVIELDDDILLEIDVNGKPRVLEVLNASMHFNVSKSVLKNNIVKIEMVIDITDNQISVEVNLTDSSKHVLLPLNNSISNLACIPVSDESINLSLA